MTKTHSHWIEWGILVIVMGGVLALEVNVARLDDEKLSASELESIDLSRVLELQGWKVECVEEYNYTNTDRHQTSYINNDCVLKTCNQRCVSHCSEQDIVGVALIYGNSVEPGIIAKNCADPGVTTMCDKGCLGLLNDFNYADDIACTGVVTVTTEHNMTLCKKSTLVKYWGD